jgi:UDP-N-acetylglucosamine 2-epimerase (non-hydrolysing)
MIYVIIGTKAQLVKMAPVMLSLDDHGLEYQFVLTGQHAETMDDLVSDFALREPEWCFVKPIEADTHLRLLSWLVKAFIGGYRGLKRSDGKDLVLVHGDTLSTLVGAILGRLRGMQVVHIEAGLRSFSYFNPFPEEIVRVLVTRISQYFVCQDDVAVGNLKHLGVSDNRIFNAKANSLMDALNYVKEKSVDMTTFKIPYCVVSLHRSENLGSQKRFRFLMQLIVNISMHTHVIFVLHPVTKKKLQATGWREEFESNPEISLLERMAYSKFMALLANASFLVTDGGSNQEEAYYLGLPCLIMREATERVEGLGSNAVLSKYNEEIIQQFFDSLEQKENSPGDRQTRGPSDQIASFLNTVSGR